MLFCFCRPIIEELFLTNGLDFSVESSCFSLSMRIVASLDSFYYFSRISRYSIFMLAVAFLLKFFYASITVFSGKTGLNENYVPKSPFLTALL